MTMESFISRNNVLFRKNAPAVFISAAIVFPGFLKPGSVAVISTQENQNTELLDLFDFREYNDELAAKFQSCYDQWKITEYYSKADSGGSLEHKRFMIELEKRIITSHDKTFPSIYNIDIGSEAQAYNPFISLVHQNQISLKSKLLKDALGNFSNDKKFDDNPSEIQAVCIAIFAAAQNAWKAFELEKIDKIEEVTYGWNELS